MKKLFTVALLLIASISFSQSTQDSSTDIYGVWVSMEDRETLILNPSGYFIRVNQEETVRGLFEVKDKSIHVIKSTSEYDLDYSVTGATLVVYKPNSIQSWIFNKVSN